MIIVKIILLSSIVHHNVEAKPLGKIPLRKSFHFELIPFKSFSFLLENLTPFGKFEMKHSLEKRDTVEEPIPNEILPVPVEEKKVLMTSVVAPPVEAPIPIPIPINAPQATFPFVIELAPKPVEVLPPPPVPVVELPPPPVEAPIGPIMYTDITKIPLINFAIEKPVPVEAPEVVLGPEIVPVIPPAPEPVPVPVEPPKPVPIVQEVIVKPVVPVIVPAPPPETPAVVPPPPLPNYIVKGSRLIIFFGSKILQMLNQFIDGRSFNEFTLPQFPLSQMGKRK